MPRLRVNRRATIDLRNIRNHYFEIDPALAKRIVSDIRNAFSHVAALPAAGHRKKEISDPNVRVYLVHSYYVIYEVKPGIVEVLHVRHAARDLEGLL